MANNIFTGPNAIVAKETVSFATAGINSTNTAKIFKIDDELQSFIPGRSINGISGFVEGQGYYLVAKVDFDLEAYVIPPIPEGGGGGGFDTDAQAFITAASISDSTQQNAIDDFVTALKTAGVWTKMKAIYPFVGGTSSQHKWNLKNPLDTDGAFRLAFTGSPTHNANGVTFGTGKHADTFLRPATHLTANNTHMSAYCKDTPSASEYIIGSQDGGNQFMLAHVGGTLYNRQYNDSTGQVTHTSDPGEGLMLGSRTGAAVLKSFLAGAQVGATQTGAAGSLSAEKTGIGALIADGIIANDGMSRSIQFVSIGDGLTDGEVSDFTAAVNALQTTLSRA